MAAAPGEPTITIDYYGLKHGYSVFCSQHRELDYKRIRDEEEDRVAASVFAQRHIEEKHPKIMSYWMAMHRADGNDHIFQVRRGRRS